MGFLCVSLSSGRPNIKLLDTSAVFYRRRPLGPILTCLLLTNKQPSVKIGSTFNQLKVAEALLQLKLATMHVAFLISDVTEQIFLI